MLKRFIALIVSSPLLAVHGKGDANFNPDQLVNNLLGFTVRQCLFSLLLLTGIIVSAVVLHWYAWLGLFGLMMMPVGASGLILLASQRWLPICRQWIWVWCILLLSVASASWAAASLYAQWMLQFDMTSFSPVQSFVVACSACVMCLCLPLWKMQSQARVMQMANLKQAALAAELKALQAQVEPHFLYNTLANTRYLVRHDAVKAVQMLDHMIAYLQNALPDLRSPMSSLEREFELAGHYLALMQLRFGDRLGFHIDLPQDLSGAALPPLMLMSLVENAVQHGVEPMPGKVNINLSARRQEGKLHILVIDSGAGMSHPGNVLGSGVGLRNLRERLSALYGDAGYVELRMQPCHDTEAELCLPLEIKCA